MQPIHGDFYGALIARSELLMNKKTELQMKEQCKSDSQITPKLVGTAGTSTWAVSIYLVVEVFSVNLSERKQNVSLNPSACVCNTRNIGEQIAI